MSLFSWHTTGPRRLTTGRVGDEHDEEEYDKQRLNKERAGREKKKKRTNRKKTRKKEKKNKCHLAECETSSSDTRMRPQGLGKQKGQQHVRWTTSIFHQSNYSLLLSWATLGNRNPGTVSYETLHFCCHIGPQTQAPLKQECHSLDDFHSPLIWSPVCANFSCNT